MGLVRRVSQLFRAIRFLMRIVVVITVTIVGWLLVGNMVGSGQLPAEPIGLAAMGLPATLFGIPTAYAVGILLLDGLLLFGESGNRSRTDGDFDDFDDDGFGDDGGGGFGDGGGGGGGGSGE